MTIFKIRYVLTLVQPPLYNIQIFQNNFPKVFHSKRFMPKTFAEGIVSKFQFLYSLKTHNIVSTSVRRL